jgi:mannose/cellobiose epimerase-like protein (N-acyl-D-glucosamine 2-epimerase family)
MNEITNPNFKDKEFLIGHIKSIMGFYHPHCIDNETGGFFQHFKDDGSIYDFDTRHLVSSTRFIFNYSMAAMQFNNVEYIDTAKHGIDYLRKHHLNKDTGGYAWTMNGKEVLDSTNYCYGLAFVLLAYSTAYKAGIKEAKNYIEETFDLMENHFWSKDHELYSDEISSDWSIVTNYRGQNANMHTCEALIQAFESTNEQKYLDRALLIAKNICIRQAGLADGLIWEHYDTNWQINWSYNKDTPDDLFRPWGFQVGHLTEWAKLLIILERHADEDWLVSRAQELFDDAIEMGWDEKSEGLVYGFAPNGDVCDNDKYFWVQAESLAAAAVLANRTGDDYYWEWYERIWEFSWKHMVDHEYGAWFRILDSKNKKYDNLKSPAGKVDYHTMGACYEVLNLGIQKNKT